MIAWTIGDEPARGDIDAYPGAAIDFTVPILDAASALVDITGWTAAAQVRAAHDAPALYTFAVTAGTDGARIVVTGAVTAAWADWATPVARWDLWVTPPASPASPIVTGWVRVHSTITH